MCSRSETASIRVRSSLPAARSGRRCFQDFHFRWRISLEVDLDVNAWVGMVSPGLPSACRYRDGPARQGRVSVLIPARVVTDDSCHGRPQTRKRGVPLKGRVEKGWEDVVLSTLFPLLDIGPSDASAR